MDTEDVLYIQWDTRPFAKWNKGQILYDTTYMWNTTSEYHKKFKRMITSGKRRKEGNIGVGKRYKLWGIK